MEDEKEADESVVVREFNRTRTTGGRQVRPDENPYIRCAAGAGSEVVIIKPRGIVFVWYQVDSSDILLNP